MRVVIADDHPLVLYGLKHALSRIEGVTVCGEARNSNEIIEFVVRHRPDVLVTDFSMPGGSYGDGVQLIGYLMRNYPTLRIIVLTMMTAPSMQRQILDLGVHGLVVKSDQESELALALESVSRGERYCSSGVGAFEDPMGGQANEGESGRPALSERELEVLRLYVNGMSVSAIAQSLCRSVKTISKQKQSAMSKLGLMNERELFEYAKTSGLL